MTTHAHRAALRRIITAWESLSEVEYHDLAKIQDWLLYKMRPNLIKARKVLSKD